MIETYIVERRFMRLKEPAPDESLQLDDFATYVSKGKKVFLSRSGYD